MKILAASGDAGSQFGGFTSGPPIISLTFSGGNGVELDVSCGLAGDAGPARPPPVGGRRLTPFLIHLPRHRVVQRGLGLGQFGLQSGLLGGQRV